MKPWLFFGLVVLVGLVLYRLIYPISFARLFRWAPFNRT